MRRRNARTIVITAALVTSITVLTACNKGTAQVQQPSTTASQEVAPTEETAPVQSTEEVASSNPTEQTTTEGVTESNSIQQSTEMTTEQPTVAPTKGTSQVPSTEEVTSSNPTVASSSNQVAPSNPTKPSTTVVAKEETTTVQPVTEQSTTQAQKVEEPTTPVQTEAPTEAPTQPPHTHSYTATVTKTATCTEEGIVTYTCSCGSSYTESVPTLSHSFGEYVYNNDATTENDGTKTATCSVCGTTDTIVAEGTKVEGPTYPPLPTESCPYPVNTIIDNGNGTYSMYYVDSGLTMDKFGISDGGAGNNAGNSFMTFCHENYLTVAFDCYIGDYAEGCISWICGQPRSL